MQIWNCIIHVVKISQVYNNFTSFYTFDLFITILTQYICLRPVHIIEEQKLGNYFIIARFYHLINWEMIIGRIVSLQKDCNAIYVCDIVSVARILDMHNSSNEDKLVRLNHIVCWCFTWGLFMLLHTIC